MGINVIGYKMVNFVIAAFMAGMSGALFASFQHNLSPDTTSRFAVTTSIYLLVYMVVGGKDYFIGPLVGTPCSPCWRRAPGPCSSISRCSQALSPSW